MRGLTRQVVVLLAVVLTIGFNGVAGSGNLFGRDPGSISDGLPNDFVPFGLTFAIWSLIFAGLVAFGVYQALPAQRGERYDRLAVPFLLANVLNVGWLLAWHSLAYGLSVLIMLGLLGSLIWLYLRLDAMQPHTPAETWCLGVPVSLYLGWIAVATIANIVAFLVSAGYRDGLLGVSAPVWSAVLVVVAALIGAFLLVRKRDFAFAAVLAWAFYGVYAARPEVATVGYGILIGALLLLAAGAVGLGRRRPQLA